MCDIKKLVKQHKDLIIDTRRELHRIPEPAYTEEKTSAYVADYLKKEDIKVQTGIAHTGVMALMKLAGPGKTLMIRSDIDALPVSEETGLPFATPKSLGFSYFDPIFLTVLFHVIFLVKHNIPPYYYL